MKRFLALAGVLALLLTFGCNRAGVVDANGATAGASSASTKGKPEPLRIAYGEQVNLRDYLTPGKTTIFDFTSKFCPPCRAIQPKMHELHASRGDLMVVEVDLNRASYQRGIDWSSPVAQQYGIHSIPAFKVFSPDGRLVAEGDKAAQQVYGMLH